MILTIKSVISICFLLVPKIVASEPEGNFIAYKCEVEYAGIWGVDIINIGSDRYFDSDGNEANRLRHGMADFYIAEEQITLEKSTTAAIRDTLNKINEWKSATVTPSESSVVGLHVKSTDFLIFHKNAWTLISFRNLNRVIMQVSEARLAIDRRNFKVFTCVPSKVAVLSEDKKIIDIFWSLETASKAKRKKE